MDLDSPTCYSLPDFPQIIHVVAKLTLGVSLLKEISGQDSNDKDSIFSANFKLLGIKYKEIFDLEQAISLTPYEIDDAMYKKSLNFLTQRDQGWLVIVLAKVNAYDDIAELIRNVFSNTNHLPSDSKFTVNQLQEMSVIVSPSPEASYKRIFSYFSESELSKGLELSEVVFSIYSRVNLITNRNTILN